MLPIHALSLSFLVTIFEAANYTAALRQLFIPFFFKKVIHFLYKTYKAFSRFSYYCIVLSI